MRLPFIYFIFFWFLLSTFTPANTYWRDSGEFIIAGSFLDVAHPAGFPLYSQLANLFTHIVPFGPLAWRINLFSTFLASLLLTLAWYATSRILQNHLAISQRRAEMFAFFSSIVIINSSAFLRQTYQAEVYMLNAVLVVVLFLGILTWRENKSNNLLILLSFISGLSVGNHVSISLSILATLIVLTIFHREIIRILPLCTIIFIFGCSVYLYIPIRAHKDIPLNTGEAITGDRFINLITNQRDRKISFNDHNSKDGHVRILENMHLLNGHFLERILADFKVLTKELSPAPVLFSVLGLLVLLRQRHLFLASLLFIIPASNWVFFAGWQTDTWIPLIVFTAVTSTITVASLFSFAASSKAPKRTTTLCIILVVGSLYFCIRPTIYADLYYIKNFDLTRRDAKLMLQNVPKNSFFMTEPSYFNLLYLTAVEGYRDDVKIVYLLDLYYPELFGIPTFKNSEGLLFTPKQEALPHPPSLHNLGDFIRFASASGVGMEPATFTNGYLKDVLTLTSQGDIRLIAGQGRSISDQFHSQIISQLDQLIRGYLTAPDIIRLDIASRIELRTLQYADLYGALDMPGKAVDVLLYVCNQPGGNLCFAPLAYKTNEYRAAEHLRANSP